MFNRAKVSDHPVEKQFTQHYTIHLHSPRHKYVCLYYCWVYVSVRYAIVKAKYRKLDVLLRVGKR